MTSILIATDRPLQGTTLGETLSQLGTVTVVPMTTALLAAKDLAAAVIIVDGDNAAAVATLLRIETRRDRRVLLLVRALDAPHVAGCLLAGADDVLLWSADRHRIAAAVGTGASGAPRPDRRELTAARRAALQRLASAEAGRPTTPDRVRLTGLERAPAHHGLRRTAAQGPALPADLGPAQREVAVGLLAGRRDAEIAAGMGVTRSAVHGAKQRLATRLGVPIQQVREALESASSPERLAG